MLDLAVKMYFTSSAMGETEEAFEVRAYIPMIQCTEREELDHDLFIPCRHVIIDVCLPRIN